MDIRLCIPSYKRPDHCRILKYIPFASVYVCQSEAQAYRKANPGAKIVAMPIGVQGHLSRARNWILNRNRGAEAVVMMDDDVRRVIYHEGNKRLSLAPEEFLPWLERKTILAREFGAKVWGININTDRQCYREYSPFSLTSVIMGHFMCYIMPVELKYDPRFTLKDDYDYCLQVLNRHRKLLRFNKFSVDCGAAWSGTGLPGGCAVMRNQISEKREFDTLIKKWGRKIVRVDVNDRNHKSTKKKVFDFNPVIKVPIAGM